MHQIKLFLISFLYQTTTSDIGSNIMRWLFLISFLYQTTTGVPYARTLTCCFLSLSYIKPQPSSGRPPTVPSCFLSLSYIKPQHAGRASGQAQVVSYLFPISNHNRMLCTNAQRLLFLISFLYQTTTRRRRGSVQRMLFLISFLYQTTTIKVNTTH